MKMEKLIDTLRGRLVGVILHYAVILCYVVILRYCNLNNLNTRIQYYIV